MRIKKAFSAALTSTIVATSMFAASNAQAVDWCQVLVCMGHPENLIKNPSMVPMCIGPLNEAFAYAKATQSWGECPSAKEANNSYTEIGSWNLQYHYNKKGQIEGVKSVNGTVNVFIEGKFHISYPF